MIKLRLSHKWNTPILSLAKRGAFLNIQKDQTSLYDSLQTKPFATQAEIKKSYYKLAKKYHPDMNEGDEHLDKFKQIQKAYEVLGNPMSRQAYDIEHRFNEDVRNDVRDDMYEDKKYMRNVFTGRKISDFYYTKWTGYKRPSWSHPFKGKDIRSEYLYRKKLHDNTWFIPPFVDIAVDFFNKYRVLIYMGAILFFDLGYYIWRTPNRAVEKMELEVLSISYNLDAPQDRTAENTSNGEQSETDIKMAAFLNEYVQERMKAISEERSEGSGDLNNKADINI